MAALETIGGGIRGAVALLAIAAMHAPLRAQDVQIYGQIRLTANRVETGSSRVHELRDNASRLGFRGREDLGDGAAALFGLEMGLDADTGAGTNPTFRHSYVGLRNALGTLALGRLDSANPTGSPLYSQVTAIVTFAPNDAGATAIGTSMLNARNRVSNAIGYRSPRLGGFELMVRGYLRGAGTAAEAENAAKSLDLGLMYRAGPVTAAVGYGKDERAGGLNANEFDDKWQAGLRWSFGFVAPYFLLGTDRFNSSGTRRRSVDYWLVGAEAPFGLHSVALNVMGKDVQSSLTGTRHRQQLAYVYRLSKRTQLQAFYDNDGVDSSRSNIRVRAIGSGVRHDF
jgi:predicted porin